ncbi:MAG: hypothetical protein K0R63_890 [Rickettsiales bacterium]|jgi:hypothetical protein|nr:hypothetical protein [Rickettsiales bacterium]
MRNTVPSLKELAQRQYSKQAFSACYAGRIPRDLNPLPRFREQLQTLLDACKGLGYDGNSDAFAYDWMEDGLSILKNSADPVESAAYTAFHLLCSPGTPRDNPIAVLNGYISSICPRLTKLSEELPKQLEKLLTIDKILFENGNVKELPELWRALQEAHSTIHSPETRLPLQGCVSFNTAAPNVLPNASHIVSLAQLPLQTIHDMTETFMGSALVQAKLREKLPNVAPFLLSPSREKETLER